MEKVDFTQGILAIQPDLHRFAYKLTADRESANDLVQDCLLQALDNQEKSFSSSFNRLRIKNKRLFTVPIGNPNFSAISLYLNPATNI